MIELFATEADCCGCGACEAICPKSNIKMTDKADGGYFYPQYQGDENCINCMLCLKVCPMKQKKNDKELSSEPVYFVGYMKDDTIWSQSSSGGAFTAICEALKSEHPIVFGARWDDFNVIMDEAGVDNIGGFRKSKYVGVNPNMTYSKVKSYLDNGRCVIYSGTPCQINGLYSYLRKDYERLFTIDFACHGQGSPVVFHKWLNHLESKYHKKVKLFKFREKKIIGDHINSNCTEYVFEDGTTHFTTRDYYHHAYVKGLHMRKSCEECRFASNRKADITLADYKHIEDWPEVMSERNASTIVCQTEKGKTIIKKIKDNNIMIIRRGNSTDIIRYNPKLVKSLPCNPMRDSFMREVMEGGSKINKVINKYCRITYREWIEYNCSFSFVSKLSKIKRVLNNIICFAR